MAETFELLPESIDREHRESEEIFIEMLCDLDFRFIISEELLEHSREISSERYHQEDSEDIEYRMEEGETRRVRVIESEEWTEDIEKSDDPVEDRESDDTGHDIKDDMCKYSSFCIRCSTDTREDRSECCPNIGSDDG